MGKFRAFIPTLAGGAFVCTFISTYKIQRLYSFIFLRMPIDVGPFLVTTPYDTFDLGSGSEPQFNIFLKQSI